MTEAGHDLEALSGASDLGAHLIDSFVPWDAFSAPTGAGAAGGFASPLRAPLHALRPP